MSQPEEKPTRQLHGHHAEAMKQPSVGNELPASDRAWTMVYCSGVIVLTLLFSGCSKDNEENAHTTNDNDSRQWLVEITNEVGLDFIHETGVVGRRDMPEIMCSGVAIFDFDNDGDLDIYLTNGASGLGEFPVEEKLVNRLYQCQPDGSYIDVTDNSGLGDRGYGMGVVVGDIDNDGDLDVYLTNYGPDKLYRNNGDGTFQNITKEAGIANDAWSASAAFLDYDRDGFLDLFVTQYVDYDPSRKCADLAGSPEYCGPKSFTPLTDTLLHNNGVSEAPSFTDVTQQAGIAAASPGAGLGVVCDDFDNDGWIDIYVANDAYANNLWINRGDGTFADQATLMGAALNLHGQPEAGMGVVPADFDRDGAIDLFVTHLNNESNTFYRNLGGTSGFQDVTSLHRLSAVSMPFTGFGVAAVDMELDGDLDIILVNGRVVSGKIIDGCTLPDPWNRYAEPNHVYLNDGMGRFDIAGEQVKRFNSQIEITRGLAVGDIDDDGDLDLLISNGQGPARLYRNDAPHQGHWLMVRAIDPNLQRDAIGARIIVHCGDQKFVATVISGSSYLSASDGRVHFGLGQVKQIDHIIVRWPSGEREQFSVIGYDRRVTLTRGAGIIVK